MARIVMVRHGETEGASSTRYWGATDVMLSAHGREQMDAVRRRLPDECFDAIVASPLRRSWESARIVWPAGPVRLERDFREVDFGDWEGLTAEEIEARDPAGFRRWRDASPDFGFPSGERRSDFKARVQRGADRLTAAGFRSALLVIHHGVIRVIAEHLTGEALAPGVPELARGIVLTGGRDGRWEYSPVQI